MQRACQGARLPSAPVTAALAGLGRGCLLPGGVQGICCCGSWDVPADSGLRAVGAKQLGKEQRSKAVYFRWVSWPMSLGDSFIENVGGLYVCKAMQKSLNITGFVLHTSEHAPLPHLIFLYVSSGWRAWKFCCILLLLKYSAVSLGSYVCRFKINFYSMYFDFLAPGVVQLLWYN